MTHKKEKRRAEHLRYYAKHREKVIARIKAYNELHPEVAAKAAAKWRSAHPRASSIWQENNRERSRTYQREYARKYAAEVCEKVAARRARKLCATPRWLTAEHKKQTRAIYREAQRRRLHVDHIVPLQGKLVSGLHVPWNLQLLTEKENKSKAASHHG